MDDEWSHPSTTLRLSLILCTNPLLTILTLRSALKASGKYGLSTRGPSFDNVLVDNRQNPVLATFLAALMGCPIQVALSLPTNSSLSLVLIYTNPSTWFELAWFELAWYRKSWWVKTGSLSIVPLSHLQVVPTQPLTLTWLTRLNS